MARTKNDSCYRFSYRMCDDVAEIVIREQVKGLNNGKFRGRNQIIDRIIREWDYSNLARNEAGTDALDTGKA
jgi:hypothetical protein